MKTTFALAYTIYVHILLLPSFSLASTGLSHGDGYSSRHRRLRRSLQQTSLEATPSEALDATRVASSAPYDSTPLPTGQIASSQLSVPVSDVLPSLPLLSSITSTSPNVNVSTSLLTTTTTLAAPLNTPSLDLETASDIQTITERRLATIVGGLSRRRAASISAYLSTLDETGKWPDSEVDYTSGCPARRANWPAQEHWQRIAVMAGAWHGGLEGAEGFVKDPTLRASISSAMDFWFANDFANPACIDSGGTARCPCSTPGFWNTNWFSNTILIPELSSETCLLLNDTLTPSQFSNCTHITLRAYDTFTRNPTFLTGANTLDVAKVGIDQGLLATNVSLLIDAYRRVHNELIIKNTTKADGIRADGSFGQHAGILYNGNYGKDYSNDLLDIETESAGTQFAANSTSQEAFATLFDGDSWMIYHNALSAINYWDFSALGRFISFPVIDGQATAGLNVNLTRVGELGEGWGSSVLTNFSERFERDGDNANAAKLIGNRMFYANDYMVHRGANYITSLKMYSKRTVNTECTNTQNPLGFHLSDGVVHTYLIGNEYEDISAAWDWNLIPGITVDYGATPLSCDRTGFTGVEAFVGGVSTGETGIAAMRYTNPFTKSLHFQKAWFFLPNDVQLVMVSNVTSSTNASVLSVLDQRLHVGSVSINGVTQPQNGSFVENSPQTLWHAGVGYVFPHSNGTLPLHVQIGPKEGNWSAIGTSTQPPPTVDLFAAYLQPVNFQSPLSYIALPGVSEDEFNGKSHDLRVKAVRNDDRISAIYDSDSDVAMIVFWDGHGGLVTLEAEDACSVTIAANGNAAVVVNLGSGDVTVSDPSQTLRQITVTVDAGERTNILLFTLPSDGLAGNSVTKSIY